jgi:hypothetical protein
MSTSNPDKGAPGANLLDMMESLGMERCGAPVPRFGHMMASAFHTCARCQSVTECREWLTAAANSTQVEAPKFCLNTDLLAEFLFEPLMKREP